ncbi:MAG: cell surface protein SprA, partial [Cyclobacteriaceae bacterium]|nr:cell surface protein SprA [Cyclobacteriaceae bacterium]
MRKIFIYSITIFLLGIVTSAWSESRRNDVAFFELSFTLQQQDTTRTDSTDVPYESTTQPTYKAKDRYGDPFSNPTSQSPLILSNPGMLSLDVEIDTGMNYTITEKIGALNYRPTSQMSFDEFKRYREREMLKDYWRSRSAGLDGESAVTGRNLVPPIYISPVLDRIFGGSTVEIIPTGFVTLDFGGRWQRIDNPNLNLRQQRSGGFEFDQQISMNVTGKVGEKMSVTANFDNNNSFDFQNNLKVEYTGYKEDILKKLELGNVSLPLNNSLINGAQNLFGVKTRLQFGKLYVTAVASQQRGKTETLEIDGGGDGQGRQFEITGADYDENRHFFLGHFFKNNYQAWLSTLPQITSGVNITRVEVYLVNRNNDTQSQRSVVGVMDLGEPYDLYKANLNNPFVVPTPGTLPGRRTDPNENAANQLYKTLQALTSNDRNLDNINSVLESKGLVNGIDFEKITGARKLAPNEFTF